MSALVVAGIGTDVGKTVVSAVLCKLLSADYWKPIVSGTKEGSVDDDILLDLLGREAEEGGRIHPCAYRLREPLSPHIAAQLDGLTIQSADLNIPKTLRLLIIELAGGVLVPINDSETNLDILTSWRKPVVLVSRHYLGSINHTLLTVEALRNRSIPIIGIIFVGDPLPDSEEIITHLSQVPNVGRVPIVDEVTEKSINQLARSGCLNRELLVRGIGQVT